MALEKYPVEYPSGKAEELLKELPVAGYATNPKMREAVDTALQGYKQRIDELENRFAQPNWYKIAAGFAKPQLGGFMASVGSAAEAAGEQQELQRAIMPTVARMRSELAIRQAGFTGQLEQQKMFEDIKSGKVKLTPETLKNVGEYGIDTPVYKALEKQLANEQTVAATQSTLQQTSAREQELQKVDPYYIPLDMTLASNWAERAKSQNETYKRAIIASGLYNPQQVAQMTPAVLQETFDAVTKQQAEKRLSDETQSGQVLANSMTTLSNLSEARNLALSPGMEKLLGLGAGQDAVSALFGYIANNDQGSYSRLAAAAQKLAQSDPETYSKFVVLQKALNTNVAQARELVANPSNQATGLLQSTYPNVVMPQKSIVTLLDLMAAQNMRDARIAALRQSDQYRDVNPNKFESSADYRAINEELKRHKNEIVEGKFYGRKQPQEFYGLSNIFGAVRQPAPVPETPKQTTSKPATTASATEPSKSTRRIRSADDLLKEAGVKP